MPPCPHLPEESTEILKSEHEAKQIASMQCLYTLVISLATAESDYTSVEGEVIFEVNQTSANITLDIINDNLPELDESVYIRLIGANLLQEEGSGGNG